MNLARALAAVPKQTKGQWKPKPAGLIESAAICYIIGQITTPVSWRAIQAWGNAKYGVSYLDDTYKQSVVRFGRKRKPRPRSMPDDLMLACVQLAIIQSAHGSKTPWVFVSDRLWVTRKITVTNRAVAMSVRAWMHQRMAG